MKKLAGMFLMALLGGAIALGAFQLMGPKQSEKIVETVITPAPVSYTNFPVPTSAPSEGLDFRYAAEKTVNAVVHVKTEVTYEPTGNNPWMDFFGYEMEPQIQMGSGSGVIISTDGYIVTNNHVIEGASRISVSLNDNKTYDAELIGTDPATDIALLKIEGKSFPKVDFGSSDDVQVGEWVLAVGNPFDLTSTVTAGIVSAKARNINLLRPDINKDIFPIESFIQTDAAVNPGNSGGALVNTKGELIGINTAIASRTGSYSGYSFAVPASIVRKITKDLKDYGTPQRAFIGVRINDVNEELAAEVGLDDIQGVYVAALVENGAAFDAGIEEGDVILSVDSKNVKNVPELQEQVNRFRPGDKVNVGVWRNGGMRNLNVQLRNSDGNTDLKMVEEIIINEALGALLSDVDSGTKDDLSILGGVQVTEIESGKLRSSGVQENFIITKVDGQNIYNVNDLEDALKGKSGGILIEGVYPSGKKAYYGFGL